MQRHSDSIMIALMFVFIGSCASSGVVHFDLRCLNVAGTLLDKPDEITWESCTLQCAAIPECGGYQEFWENGTQVCRLLKNVKRNELGDELVNVRLGPGEFELCPTYEQRRCLCGPGFLLDESFSDCLDIEECFLDNGGCSQICINTLGSYYCECDNGYELKSDKRNCTDIDECAKKKGGCAHYCINTPGSYRCTCQPGYMKDGRVCRDIDECKRNNGGCSNRCVNTVGSYRCECPSGFRIGNDTKTCTDIDECAGNIVECSHICVNTSGSYRCECRKGFELRRDGRTCRKKR